jgi:hypothetical protein
MGGHFMVWDDIWHDSIEVIAAAAGLMTRQRVAPADHVSGLYYYPKSIRTYLHY